MTPEGRVKAMVKKYLATLSYLYQHWPVQNGMGAPTLDCIGSHMGRYFAIETKAPGKKMTPRQETTARSIRASGGQVFVIDGAESMAPFIAWVGKEPPAEGGQPGASPTEEIE
jgi:hypothetical protein